MSTKTTAENKKQFWHFIKNVNTEILSFGFYFSAKLRHGSLNGISKNTRISVTHIVLLNIAFS